MAFDLSEVLFITTANVLDTIPAPLRDRMEMLELPGYTEEEKLKIAKEHLVAKQVANHGLTPDVVAFTDEALRLVIHGFTREAGVRSLEREIASLCRKIARRRAEGLDTAVTLSRDTVVELLGAPRYLDEEIEERTKNPGVAIGMAWTPVGGEVLFIEASRMHIGTLTLTGHLGDVEGSAGSALVVQGTREPSTSIRFLQGSGSTCTSPGSHSQRWPSAGVTMAVALASELTGRPVRGDIAMTGEITLSGRILPVGGIKEKVLAARRLGIKEVVLPRQNDKDVKEDLSDELRRDLTIHLVSSIDEALLLALTPPSMKHRERRNATRVQGTVQ